ncbi:MAG: hypothetical protein ABUK01_17840 [Leptospirales bacterium]
MKKKTYEIVMHAKIYISILLFLISSLLLIISEMRAFPIFALFMSILTLVGGSNYDYSKGSNATTEVKQTNKRWINLSMNIATQLLIIIFIYGLLFLFAAQETTTGIIIIIVSIILLLAVRMIKKDNLKKSVKKL